MKYKWKINAKDLLTNRKPKWVILGKHYENLKTTKKDVMYEEEMKDLQNIYLQTKDTLENEIENTLPSLIYYMKTFIELHDQKNEIKDRLDILKIKKKSSEEEND